MKIFGFGKSVAAILLLAGLVPNADAQEAEELQDLTAQVVASWTLPSSKNVSQGAQEEAKDLAENSEAEFDATIPVQRLPSPPAVWRLALPRYQFTWNNVDPSVVGTEQELGLTLMPIEALYQYHLGLAEGQGVMVAGVDEAGQGYKNGLRTGDIIYGVGSDVVGEGNSFYEVIAKGRGEQQSIKVRRGGRDVKLLVKLVDFDDSTLKRWIIGIHIGELDDLAKSQLGLAAGIVVTDFTEDSPAQAAGLVVHDIITNVNGADVASADDLRKVLSDGNGEPVQLKFMRQGNTLVAAVQPNQIVDATAYNSDVDLWLQYPHPPNDPNSLAINQYIEFATRDRTASDWSDLLTDYYSASGQIDPAVPEDEKECDLTIEDRIKRVEDALAELKAAMAQESEDK